MTNDLGALCDRHVGQVFPPRCDACDLATLDASDNRLALRLGFIPGSSCPHHTDYPLPCALCERLEAKDL